MDRNSCSTVDKDELWAKYESSSLTVGTNRRYAPSPEFVIYFSLASYHSGTLVRGKVNGSCHYEWILVLFAELSPVANIGKDVIISFKVFFTQFVFVVLVLYGL